MQIYVLYFTGSLIPCESFRFVFSYNYSGTIGVIIGVSIVVHAFSYNAVLQTYFILRKKIYYRNSI